MLRALFVCAALAAVSSSAYAAPVPDWRFVPYAPLVLPHRTPDDSFLGCDGQGFVYIDGQTFSTTFLAGACPEETFGVSTHSVIATFGNGLYSFDLASGEPTLMTEAKPQRGACFLPTGLVAEWSNGLYFIANDGDTALLTEAKPSEVYGCTSGGAVAAYSNGVYYLEYDGDFQVLSEAVPEIVYGHNATGVVAAFSNGFYFLGFDGNFTQLSEAKPKYVMSVTPTVVRACYQNGIYEFSVSSGSFEQLSTACPL